MPDIAVPIAVQAILCLSGVLVLRLSTDRPSPYHPGIALGLPYFAITTGPALNYLLFGLEPYGIHLEMLARALWVAVMAQAGIVLGCAASIFAPVVPRRFLALRSPRRFRTVAMLAYGVVFAVSAYSLYQRYGTLVATGKVETAEDIWVRLHYATFLLMLALLPAVLISDQILCHRMVPRRSQLAIGLFALLCLLSAERDLVLVLIMVPIAWAGRSEQRLRPQRGFLPSALRALGVFVAIGLLLVTLQWARGEGGLSPSGQVASLSEKLHQESMIQGVLGLGSNLFIVSRVVEWIPTEIPYQLGATYAHTLVNLLPSFVLPQLHYESLLSWFKERYAPTSDSGYGFAMEAEAYMNFGLAGPLAIFCLWTLGLCRLFERQRIIRHAFLYQYGYTFMLPFSLYCFRGDSVMWVKGFLYASGVVWVLARISGVRTLVRRKEVLRRKDSQEGRYVRPRPSLKYGWNSPQRAV